MTASASLNRHRVVAFYAVGAAAWILGSDLVVTLIHGAPLSAVVPNSLKGLLFVAVTSLLLHLLLSPLPAQQAPADPGTPFRGSRLFAFIAAATVITASAGGVIWVMHAEHVAATEEALESVGKLKLELIQTEIAERKLDLDLLRDPRGSERPMAIQVTSGNPLERATARARLDYLRARVGHDNVSAYALDGTRLVSVGAASHMSAGEVGRALASARDMDATLLLGPGRGEDALLYFVAPLRDRGGALHAVVVAELDVSRDMMQRINPWPTPSASGEVVIALRDGELIRFLTRTLVSDPTARPVVRSASDPDLVARKVLDGARGIVSGLDYRGKPAIAWVAPVAGTSWVLIAKQDRAEALGDSMQWTAAIGALGLAAILVAGFMLRLSWQQENIAWTNARLREQVGRVDAERQLELATRAGGIGTFEWNLADDRLVWNEQHAQLWNTTLAAFPGTFEAFASQLHPDDLVGLKAEVTACRKGGREFAQEFRVLRPDGGVRWIAARGRFVDDAPGKPGRMYGTVLDVSRGREEQAERVRLAGLLQSIVNGSTDAIFAKDLQGRYLLVNAPTLAAFGKGEAEVLGRTDAELFPQPDAGAVMARDRALLAREEVDTVEETVHTSQGIRTFLVTKGPMFDVTGVVTGLFGIARDITERVKAATAMAEAEASFRLLFSANPVPMWVADEAARRILEVNQAAIAQYGYSREEFLAIDLVALRPEEDRQRFLEHIRSLAPDMVDGRIWRHRCKDGRIIDVSTRANRVEWAGKPARLVQCLDVTAQQRAGRELAESEVRYRQLFADNPHPMWVFDAGTLRILAVNDMAITHYGYSREEFLGMGIQDIRPAEDAAALKAHVAAHPDGAVDAGYWRHRIKDGTLIDVHVVVHDTDWDGRQAKVALSIDVTAQHKAEAELRDALQMLELTVEGGEIGTWDWDLPTGRTTYNARWAQMLGYDVAEIKQDVSSWKAIVHPDDMPQVMERIRACVDGETPAYESEHRLRHKDGHWVWVLDKGKVTMHDTAGRAVRLSGTHLDITRRKRTDAVLAEERAQLRAVVDQSIVGMYVIQDGRVAFCNQRYADILGYDNPDQLAGVDMLGLIAPEFREAAIENVRKRIEGEVKSVAYEMALLRPDGSRVEVGAHGSGATWRGQPAIIGVLQDISDKKRAEEAIQRYIRQIEEAFLRTVEVASALSEMRDPYTAGHERRVAELAVAIGRELGNEEGELEGLRVAGMLHDVGKILVPAEILAKPGKLSAVEYELVKGHVEAGYEVLKNVDFPWPVADMVRQHHERLDGTGYPLGLKGEAILPQSRIMAVADTVEAMSSHRPYRPGLGIAPALEEIERGRGTIYDPAVVDACLRLFRDKGYVIPA